MWRPWGKSTARIHSSSTSSLPSSPFSCSSFKDIQTLCLDEPPHQSLPSSPTPKYPIFHRVLLANSFLRTWSTHLHQQPHRLPRSRSHPEPESEPKPLLSPLPLPEPEPEQETSHNEIHAIHAPPELSPTPTLPPPIYFPGTEQRVVIYFTSLRVVRPIFEDCKSALAILRAFRVHLDERDVTMDSSFLSELNRIMGRTGLALPRVFIGGRYIGGGEEIRTMHEIGELKKILEDLPVVDPTQCHVCAGYRFILCNVCNGSTKVYTDKAGFKICSVCNENGLLRCPNCFPDDLINNEKVE